MKKIFFLLALCFSIAVSFAQHVPQGMKYQAVARNLSGNVLANQAINLKINLLTQDSKTSVIYYSETHTVTTNQLGLFTLSIGEGTVEKGTFSSIPWSTADIWMQVAIKDKSQQDFVTVSNSKLLAVPYAFHSETASSLVGVDGKIDIVSSQATAAKTGVPSQVWSLNGNSGVDPTTDRLGTTDLADLVLITNNVERLRITSGGDVNLKNTLNVGNNLNVTGATNLQNTLDVTGATHLKNTLTTDGIENITNNTTSTSPTNGALVVTGGTGIGGNLNVGGTVNFGGASSFGGQLHITNQTQSTTTSTGALIVDGGAGIAKNLNVGGAANVTGATTLSSKLDVTDSTHLKNALITDGATTLNNSLTVTKSDTSFVATIINSNDGDGDGLKIKLGKAKSVYTVPSAPTFSQTETDQFKDLIRCDYSGDKLTLLGNIILGDATETAKVIAGIAISAGNYIVAAINTGLGLPLTIPDVTVPAIHLSNSIDVSSPINTNLGLPIYFGPYSTPKIDMPAVTLPALSVDLGGVLGSFNIIGSTTLFPATTLLPATQIFPRTQIVPSLPALSIPAIDVPQTTLLTGREVMPRLPQISVPGIPAIDITNLDFWGLNFNFCLSDAAGSTPLNNNNEFIRFTDKNDAKVGSIRGVSVTNWATNYLNPSFLFKLRGALLSSKMDKFHAQYHFKNEITTALASYATIGVEYSSGNGDYAEWLERMDKSEIINAGDIVGVKSGKITKDLKGAEQVMVVSSNPIILGNIPAEGNNYEGNNIAFMGQVPVKIMGPVTTGDYIIGESNTPGYGIAKHENKMSPENFKNAVGRAWATDESDGPKMVNTVVGVHNNNFINLIKDLKERTDKNEARLKILEERLNMSYMPKSRISPKKSLK